MEDRNAMLCSKKICRFCMTQSDPLTNIYSKENSLENAVPLPLQIMACVSIEVFRNDGMPTTICDRCRVLMDRSYRFKQICKKSDSSLRQFLTTGEWPEPIPLPDDIAETINVKSLRRRHSNASQAGPSPAKRMRTSTKPAEKEPTPSSSQKSPKSKTPVKQQPKILNSQSSERTAPVVQNTKPIQVVISKSQDGDTSDFIIEESGNYSEMDDDMDEEEYNEMMHDSEENSNESQEDLAIKTAAPVATDVFPCEHCERSFPLRQLLDIHMRHHTRERSFSCAICKKSFFSKYDLSKHMSVHTGIKPFKCVVCKKKFARATLLHRHEKIHVDTPKFLCNSCDKTFLSLEELDRHEQNHKKNRPFSCTQCKKSFAFKQGLERHEMIHAKDKPFKCEYCEEGFTTPGKLARHVTAHAGSRPYPCKLCTKSFLLSHHLTRHLKSHAAGSVAVVNYKCEECGEVFQRKDELIYHSAVHATQSLTCPLCKDRFEDVEATTEHIKSHTEGEQFPCDFCDLIFTTEDRLLLHIDEIHNEGEDNEENVKEEPKEYIAEKKDKSPVVSASPKASKQTKARQESTVTPIRRSQRSSGRVKDYASMIKTDFGSDEDEEEILDDEDAEYIPKVEVKTEPIKPTRVVKPVVKASEPVKTYGQKAKPKATEPEVLKKETPVESSEKEVDDDEKTKTPKVGTPKILNKVVGTPEGATTQVVKKMYVKASASTSQVTKTIDYASKTVESPKVTSTPVPTKNVAPIKKVATKTDTKVKESTDESEVKKTNDDNEIIAKAETSEAKPADIRPTLQPIAKKMVPISTKLATGQKAQIVEMIIGDKLVKVQKIMMSKSEVEAMAKEGKIEMKGGTMLLKQGTKYAAKTTENKTKET